MIFICNDSFRFPVEADYSDACIEIAERSVSKFYVPDPSNCRKYIICKNQVYTPSAAQDCLSMAYNPDTQFCDRLFRPRCFFPYIAHELYNWCESTALHFCSVFQLKGVGLKWVTRLIHTHYLNWRNEPSLFFLGYNCLYMYVNNLSGYAYMEWLSFAQAYFPQSRDTFSVPSRNVLGQIFHFKCLTAPAWGIQEMQVIPTWCICLWFIWDVYILFDWLLQIAQDRNKQNKDTVHKSLNLHTSYTTLILQSKILSLRM